MALSRLAEMSPSVLSVTLLMDARPAERYSHPNRKGGPSTNKPKASRMGWRATVKRVIRPFVPPKVRTRVRLTLVSTGPGTRIVDGRPADTGRPSDAPRRAA